MALNAQENQNLVGKTWIPIIIDKMYNGHHTLNLPETINISTDDVMFGDYDVVIGKNAILEFNRKFKNENKIPEILDPEMYRVSIYKMTPDKWITILEINIKKIMEFMDRGAEIPHKTPFLSEVLRFHYSYENFRKKQKVSWNNSFDDEKELNEQRKKISTSAMDPVDFHHDPTIDQPVDCTLPLRKDQRANIKWMLDLENKTRSIQYNLNDEVFLGDLVWNLKDKVFIELSSRESLKPRGGALIDEVGVGKTVQIITLAMQNPSRDKRFVRDKHSDEGKYCDTKFYSKATMIICTRDIAAQWKREIEKCVKGSSSLKIILISRKTAFVERTYQDFLEADFVIVPYTMFTNDAFVSLWSLHKSYHKSKTFNHQSIEDKFTSMGRKLLSTPKESLVQSHPLFTLIHWHRLVVDEFHEAVSAPEYIYVKNILPHLHAKYRWIMTGTPFINNLMVDNCAEYIFDYPEDDIEKIIVNPDITTFMLDYLFRRNTKESIGDEWNVPEPEEISLMMRFSATERMMYNAYLANHNNKKNDVYLRQLCCHPKLSDQTNYILSTCRTLEDIERVMVQHYRNEAIEAFNKMLFVRNRTVVYKERVQLYKTALKKFVKKNKNFFEKKYLESIEKEMKGTKEDEFPYDDVADFIGIEKGQSDKGDDMVLEGIEDILVDDKDDELEYGEDGKKKIKFGVTENGQIRGIYKLRNSIENFKRSLKRYREKYDALDGKMTTYKFYQSVVKKIRKLIGDEEEDKIIKLYSETAEQKKIEDETDHKHKEKDDDDDEDDEEVCVVCLMPVEEDQIGITKCCHIGCYECLTHWVSSNNQCPECNKPLKESEITMLNYDHDGLKEDLTEEQKAHQELINKVGTKLATLISYLKKSGEHTIIFSQWNDLLKRVGGVLSTHGIKNIFCQGNVYQRDLAIRTFTENDDYKVIMLSSESSAAGTNITKASTVIFLDPIYGERKFRLMTENQAIGRAHRMGQTKRIKVIRMVIRDSIEEDIYDDNKAEDSKHGELKIKEVEYEEKA